MIVSQTNTDLSWLHKKDGASLIAKYLFEQAHRRYLLRRPGNQSSTSKSEPSVGFEY